MINSDLSTEENLNQLFDKLDNLIQQVEAVGRCDDSDRKNVAMVIDDITYYVDLLDQPVELRPHRLEAANFHRQEVPEDA